MLLRPSTFHRHHGGWLPLSKDRHRGVLQCSWRSFWALFPENCRSVFCRAACSVSHINAASFDPMWNVNARRVGDTARPPPHVGFPTRAIWSAWWSRYVARTSLVAPASERASSITCVHVLGPTRLAAAISIDRSYGPTAPADYMSSSAVSHIVFLSRLLAVRYLAPRLQDSNNLNGCRYRTILRWENDGQRRTQVHCFAACRRLLLHALNRRSFVNWYPQCRLRSLVLGRYNSTRPDSTRLSWIELSQVGRCAHGFRL